MTERTCSIDGCDKPVRARGWCATHHTRWWRHGDPTAHHTTGRNQPRVTRRRPCTECGTPVRTTLTEPTCRPCRQTLIEIELDVGPGTWVRDGLILRFQPATPTPERNAA